MTDNPHFATASSWKAARGMLTFEPVEPRKTAGLGLQSLRIHVRDHKMREVAIGDRTLEAHYGKFVLSQVRKGEKEARRLVLEVSYGRAAQEGQISGCEARLYELGPKPEQDDIDGRSPAVVVWHEREMFYLIASAEMSCDELVVIANSLYDRKPKFFRTGRRRMRRDFSTD